MAWDWLRREPVRLDVNETAAMNALCERVAALIQSTGRPTPAFSAEKHALPRAIRGRVEAMQVYEELLNHHIKSEGARDQRAMLWKFFKRMGYTPLSDICDRIEDEDIIEVYNVEGDQIYRSLNYFDISSMSVEDLVSMNWKRTFKRNAAVKLRLLGVVFRFATGQFHSTYDCTHIPVHNVQETVGSHHVIELNLKYISPLRQNGKCAGLIATSRAHVLSVG